MTHALGMDKARGWRTKSVCSDLSVYSEEPSTPLASRMFDREKQLGARPGGDGEGEGEGSSEGEEGGVWVYLRGRASAVGKWPAMSGERVMGRCLYLGCGPGCCFRARLSRSRFSFPVPHFSLASSLVHADADSLI